MSSQDSVCHTYDQHFWNCWLFKSNEWLYIIHCLDKLTIQNERRKLLGWLAHIHIYYQIWEKSIIHLHQTHLRVFLGIYRPCKHHISTTVAKVAYTYFSLLICQPTLSTIAIHFKRALLNDVNELIFYVKISSWILSILFPLPSKSRISIDSKENDLFQFHWRYPCLLNCQIKVIYYY